ncbi:MAG: PstC family ABC transporter permease [Solirubrobacterales bacterium]
MESATLPTPVDQPAEEDRTNRRVELLLGALASSVLLFIVGMLVFTLIKAWPSFAANGLAWFGAGGNVDQQLAAIFDSPADAANFVYTLRAWPLIWATIVVTGLAVITASFIGIFSSVFIVEFAPGRLQAVIEPVVKFLAAVPSVVYGLIGILVVVPFIRDTFIDESMRESVRYVVQLDGSSVLAAVLILTVMILPIMIAIIVDSLREVPVSWREGAIALGVNRWRAMITVSLRAIRPAVIAATVLAVARALGEAVMLAMVAGSIGFAPNPFDGLMFFLEPTRPLAPTILDGEEGLSVVPFGETMYAFGFVLLFSTALFSFAGWVARASLGRYGVNAR